MDYSADKGELNPNNLFDGGYLEQLVDWTTQIIHPESSNNVFVEFKKNHVNLLSFAANGVYDQIRYYLEKSYMSTVSLETHVSVFDAPILIDEVTKFRVYEESIFIKVNGMYDAERKVVKSNGFDIKESVMSLERSASRIYDLIINGNKEFIKEKNTASNTSGTSESRFYS